MQGEKPETEKEMEMWEEEMKLRVNISQVIKELQCFLPNKRPKIYNSEK